ncbi:Alkaline phosphatase D (APaseD) [Durusdinium trenchii]|uniref:Alkaline phosphatase D (APaseD) n=1 Tax=Durusdinium trenchii TaxID=1381693 RepID=A0ABP0MZM3_9DINO
MGASRRAAVIGVVAAVTVALAPARGFRIGYGSCNNQNLTQLMWDHVVDRNPDLWLWGGDNIYGDVRVKTVSGILELYQSDPEYLWNLHKQESILLFPATPEKLAYLYEKQKNHPGYQRLLRHLGPGKVLGIWDDHDFGLNDYGKYFEHKVESQREFLKFLDVPKDDPRWEQDGVYAFEDVAGNRVRVFLLDNRFHRDNYTEGNGDMLGDDQWEWLASGLDSSTADFNLLVSGIQVLPDFAPRTRFENWARLPQSRARLLELISGSSAQGVLLVSGDVHFAELLQADCTCTAGNESATFALPEITSSGMTHSWNTYPQPLPHFMQVAQAVLPFRYVLDGKIFLDLNFAEFDIELDNPNAKRFTAKILDQNGQVALEHTWPHNILKPNRPLSNCTCGPHSGRARAGPIESGILISVCAVLALLPVVGVLATLQMLCAFVCCRSCVRRRIAPAAGKHLKAD